MKARQLVLSVVAACCPVSLVSGAVQADRFSASRPLEAGLVRMVPVTPLRVSAGSVVTESVEPVFPREMRQAGIPGYVKLELVVDDDGRVCEAYVLESSAGAFSRAALKAAAAWRFVPAEDPDPSRRRIVRVPIQFDLVTVARR